MPSLSSPYNLTSKMIYILHSLFIACQASTCFCSLFFFFLHFIFILPYNCHILFISIIVVLNMSQTQLAPRQFSLDCHISKEVGWALLAIKVFYSSTLYSNWERMEHEWGSWLKDFFFNSCGCFVGILIYFFVFVNQSMSVISSIKVIIWF